MNDPLKTSTVKSKYWKRIQQNRPRMNNQRRRKIQTELY